MDLFESTQLPDGSWERTIYKTLPHYQYSTSALALETLNLHTPKETTYVAKHIKYLLSLREGERWRFRSYNETRRQMRANVFMVLNAIQKFRPHILGNLQ